MGLVSRVVSVVVGLAVFVGLLLVAAEISLARIGHGPWVLPWDGWRSWALRASWESTQARLLFVILVLAGLVLLRLLFARRTPATLPLRAGGVSHGHLGRRSLEQSLARWAQRLDGVTGARARIRPKRARVVVTTSRKVTGDDLRPQVAGAARDRLAGLGLTQVPPVAVDVNVREGGR